MPMSDEAKLLRSALIGVTDETTDPALIFSQLRAAGIKFTVALRAREIQEIFDSGNYVAAQRQAEVELEDLRRGGAPDNIGTRWARGLSGVNYPLPKPDARDEAGAAALRRIIARCAEARAMAELNLPLAERNADSVYIESTADMLMHHGIGSAHPLIGLKIVRNFEMARGRGRSYPFHTATDAQLRCFAETFDHALDRGNIRLLNKIGEIIRDGGPGAGGLDEHVAWIIQETGIYPPSRPLAEVVERAFEDSFKGGPAILRAAISRRAIDEIDVGAAAVDMKYVPVILEIWSAVAEGGDMDADEHLRELTIGAEHLGFDISVVSNSVGRPTDAGFGPEL